MRISSVVAPLSFLLALAVLITPAWFTAGNLALAAEDKAPAEEVEASAVEEEEEAEEEIKVSSLNGTITVGVGTVGIAAESSDDESAKYGEYIGITEKGGYFIGDADLLYDWKDKYYLEVKAKDIGLENKSVNVETGRWGGYKVFVNHQTKPHYFSKNSQVIHDGSGSAALTLPFDRTTDGGSDPASMANTLSANIKNTELKLDRNSTGIGFSIPYGKLSVGMSVNREEKEGTKPLGSVVGTFSGDRRAIVLPEPIDYTTDEFTATLDYRAKNASVSFRYYLSNFKSGNDSFTWANPYSGASYPDTARTSLAPDNQHQRISVSGNLLGLPYSTRISILAESGVMKQDERLLDYSNNPSAVITTARPRANADTEIATTHFFLNISSRPVPKLGLNVKYRQYKTDNKTPKDLFQYVINDGTQQAAVDGGNALYNLPYDYDKKQLMLGANYILRKRTNLSLGYVNETVNRSYREIEKTMENKYKASLSSHLNSTVSARVNYTYAQRSAVDDYNTNSVFLERHSDAYIASISDTNLQFDNHPDIRKYDIADRDQTKVRTSLDFNPDGILFGGLNYVYRKDDYKDSTLGMQYAEDHSFTVDGTLFPADFISVTAYYTFQTIESRQRGRYFADSSSTSQISNTDMNWTTQHFEAIPTIGIGTDFSFMGDALTIELNYMFSESSTEIQFSAGSGLPPAEDLPELKTKLTVMDFTGRYLLKDNWTLGLMYQLEKYESDDFATDGVSPMSGTLAEVITMTGSVPDYEAHMVMMFVTYSFMSEE